MRIVDKLSIHTVSVTLFSVILSSVILGSVSYFSAKKVLEKEGQNRLIAVRDIKKDQIEKRFKRIQRQATVIANDPIVIEATEKFIQAFENYDQEVAGVSDTQAFKSNVIKHYLEDFEKSYQAKNGGLKIDSKPLVNFKNATSFALQYHYIFNNPHPLSREESLDYVIDHSTYSEVHKQFHPRFRQFLYAYQYYDLALVDSISGNIVYSTFKDFDYTTSLLMGPYHQTGMGQVFKQANRLNKNQSIFGDFESYLPAFDKPISFLGIPIFKGNARIGVLLIKLSVDSVNETMTNYQNWEAYGLGKTGETYLVGPDYKMRSMSRFFIESPEQYLKRMQKLKLPEKTLTLMKVKNTSIGLQTVKTPGSTAALKGETGFSLFKDYRKTWVLSAFAPLKITGLNWAILSEIDRTEAFKPAVKLAWKVLFYGLLIAVLVIVMSTYFGYKIGRQITEPIQDFCDVINELSETQDLTKRIQVRSSDELAEMAKSLNRLLINLQTSFQETITSSKKVKLAANKLRGFAQNIDESLVKDQEIGALSEASDDLEVLSDKLQHLSDQFRIFEEASDRTSDW